MLPRDYTPLLNHPWPGLDQPSVMRVFVDGLWDRFGLTDGQSDTGRGAMSWVGFYTWSRQAPEEMTLAYRRNKPACSPIGLHGACGRCFISRRPLVVVDVARLGAGYIACDPRDRSEVVLPLLNPDGTSWGVLDIDSYDLGAFTEFDALTLSRLLRHAGLSAADFDSQDAVEVV